MKALNDTGYDGAINFELEDVPGAVTPTSAVSGAYINNEMENELRLAKEYITGLCKEQGIAIQ